MGISAREQKILGILLERGELSSSAVHETFKEEGLSLVTIKRALSGMATAGLLEVSGRGRSSAYRVSLRGRIRARIDAHAYCLIEPDRRHGLTRFNADLFPALPDTLFTAEELAALEEATTSFRERTRDVSPAIEKRELERFVIELAWKSSKIEGNTYTLLDTEKLILENKAAVGHKRDEAQMIINHKDAFVFVREHSPDFKTLSRAHIEELHAILVHDMGVSRGLRTKAVGVTGSIYQPLDNQHQLREGFDALVAAVSRMRTPYDKALLALAGLSYLQPFEDGNKRTARLLANAILLAYDCSPLSYRSVSEEEYRESTLVFYEINSIDPFKGIFIGQYEFSAGHYTAK